MQLPVIYLIISFASYISASLYAVISQSELVEYPQIPEDDLPALIRTDNEDTEALDVEVYDLPVYAGSFVRYQYEDDPLNEDEYIVPVESPDGHSYFWTCRDGNIFHLYYAQTEQQMDTPIIDIPEQQSLRDVEEQATILSLRFEDHNDDFTSPASGLFIQNTNFEFPSNMMIVTVQKIQIQQSESSDDFIYFDHEEGLTKNGM